MEAGLLEVTGHTLGGLAEMRVSLEPAAVEAGLLPTFSFQVRIFALGLAGQEAAAAQRRRPRLAGREEQAVE